MIREMGRHRANLKSDKNVTWEIPLESEFLFVPWKNIPLMECNDEDSSETFRIIYQTTRC
jgi:hypothetical protein